MRKTARYFVPPSARHAGKPASGHLPHQRLRRAGEKFRAGRDTGDDRVETPAKITADACLRPRSCRWRRARPRGFRRIDRLQWLKDHGTIDDHQLFAGGGCSRTGKISKIEASPRMSSGGRAAAARPGASDAALDAGRRVARRWRCCRANSGTLTELFLMPEDHPFSLERVAAIVKEDRRAAAFGIRIALSLLAKHYGYVT